MADIMIVEDEAIIAMDLQFTLTALGHDVISVLVSGEEALLSAEKRRPDIVLMDINLKGEMDGVTCARHLSSSYLIPVIFLTSFTTYRKIADQDKIPRSAFIGKPFDSHSLERIISSLLSQDKAVERELASHKS